MRKKIICLSLIVGLFLSVGLGVTKEATQRNRDSRQNTNLSVSGPIIPTPEFMHL